MSQQTDSKGAGISANMKFPKLIPAFIVQVVLDPTISVGPISSGGPLTFAPFASASGSVRSIQGYPVHVDAVFVHGADFIRQDPSGKHVRLDVNSVLKDASGAFISFKYTGIINLTPGVAAVFADSPDAATTPFGDAFTSVVFETGSEQLKALEQKVYVGAGRFIIQSGKAPVVEYLVSEVGF